MKGRIVIQERERFVIQLGDKSPIDCDGLFVYVSESGRARVEVLQAQTIDTDPPEFMEHQELIQNMTHAVHQAWANSCDVPFDHEKLTEISERLLNMVEDQLGYWKVYQFDIDQCTYQNGILSDNRFHPDSPAWFAADIKSVAEYADFAIFDKDEDSGRSAEEVMIMFLCSDDPIDRAKAYEALFDYHGSDNFDEQPLEYFFRGEVEARYKVELSQSKGAA